MYWLRWHYHVKDIAGAPYKINKKSKQKRQNRRQSVEADNSYTVQYSHDRLVIVKRTFSTRPLTNTHNWPAASTSEATALRRYTNLIIIIIIKRRPEK